MSKSVGKILISTFALITGLSAIAYANFVMTYHSSEAPTKMEQPSLIKKLEGSHFLAFIENAKNNQ